MVDKCEGRRDSVQVTRAAENSYIRNTAIAIISTNFIDMFNSFEWVHKLLVWTKGFQMALVKWKTNVKAVETVYR